MDINYKSKKREEIFNIETVTTLSVILICLLLFAFFTVKGSFQQVILGLVVFLLLPLLYIKVILKEDLNNFGFKINKWKEGFFIFPVCLLIMGGFFYIIFSYTNFSQNYFLGKYDMVNSYAYLFVYEFLIVNLFVFLYEVFFRGFVMFYFGKRFNVYTIFIQFLLFLIFLDMMGRLSMDYVFYMMTALLAGMIAYKSKSLVYSYLFSIIVLIASDIIYLKLTK
ncbi:MAG: hypothetical protein WC682_02145 [Parcubacteria group bacterium]|jgi:hypothetical protein